MIKFRASDQWYQRAASQEDTVCFVSGGEQFFRESNFEDNIESMDLDQIRKKEGFATLLRMLRLNAGFTYEELSSKIRVDVRELILLEKKVGYSPNPRTLVALSKFYKIPTDKLLKIGGAYQKVDKNLDDQVIRFAAESESFDKLTKEEKKLMDNIIKFLAT